MIRFKETEVTPPTEEEIRQSKEKAIQQLSGIEDLDVSELSNEDLDFLLSKVINESSIYNKSCSIIECLSLLDSKEQEIVEELCVQTGMKLEEAKKVLDDVIQEKTAEPSQLEKILGI